MERTEWGDKLSQLPQHGESDKGHVQAAWVFLLGRELQRIADALEAANKAPGRQALVYSVQGPAILGDLTPTQVDALRAMTPPPKKEG